MLPVCSYSSSGWRDPAVAPWEPAWKCRCHSSSKTLAADTCGYRLHPWPSASPGAQDIGLCGNTWASAAVPGSTAGTQEGWPQGHTYKEGEVTSCITAETCNHQRDRPSFQKSPRKAEPLGHQHQACPSWQGTEAFLRRQQRDKKDRHLASTMGLGPAGVPAGTWEHHQGRGPWQGSSAGGA